MIHSNTELLIDYWRRQRGERRLPLRQDIDPAGFARLAPKIFLAARSAAGRHYFRLAGEEVIELHGRSRPDLGDFLSVWRPDQRRMLVKTLASAMAAAEPVVVEGCVPLGPGRMARLEFLFAPLEPPRLSEQLFLGLCQPLGPSPWPGVLERGLMVTRIDGLEPPAPPARLRLAAVDGRLTA